MFVISCIFLNPYRETGNRCCGQASRHNVHTFNFLGQGYIIIFVVGNFNIYTVREFLEQIKEYKISRITVWSHIKHGNFTYSKKAGTNYLFTDKDVRIAKEFLEVCGRNKLKEWKQKRHLITTQKKRQNKKKETHH
jgi:hypothetical protein